MTADQIVGAILGGAIGDGWGGPYEGGVPRGRARAPDELVVSDDTQLTLATCEAVVETGAIVPERIAARFVARFRAGQLRGLGASTLKALRDLDAGAHWALAGAKGERTAGNGAAMRIAPLAFLLDPWNEGDRRTLRDVCRITHHHDEAYVGALAIAAAIRLVSMTASPPAGLLTDVASVLPDSQVRDRMLRYAGFPGSVSVFQIADTWGSSGFVADSVPLAIFAAKEIGTRTFVEVMEDVIQAGGDTDTIASMAGQIAGTAVGSAALPTEILARLRHGEAIGRIARAFAGLCSPA